MILNMPFPQMLKTMMVPSAISAISQFVEALEMADGVRDRPMQMMMGHGYNGRQIMHDTFHTCQTDHQSQNQV